MSNRSNKELLANTIAIHADDDFEDTTSVAPPIYQTSTFSANSSEEFEEIATVVRNEHFYTRYGNPTSGRTASVVAALEKTETAIVTASGMGAISTAVIALIGKGDHIIAQQNHYGGTVALLRDLLPRFGVDVTFVEQTDAAAFENAITPATKLIIVESPSNPLMRITDLQAIANIAKKNEIITLADNTFATPVNQRPAETGIDLVVHSATKYMGGHSDITAGVIAGSAALINKIWSTSLILGSVLAPFESWLLLRGLRTLSLRVEMQNRTALAIANFLESHPKIKRVHYPGLKSHPQYELAGRQMSGFTGIISFEIKGGVEAAEHFISAMRLAKRAASVGGVETLLVRPVAMLSKQLSEEEFRRTGVSPELIRMSIGLEDEQDLIKDITRALV